MILYNIVYKTPTPIKYFENESGNVMNQLLTLWTVGMSADWRSCRKMETGARIDKWGGEYPLNTAGLPRSQTWHVRTQE